MQEFFVGVGLALLVSASLVLYRVVMGPSVMDRIVAVNVIGTKTTLLLLVIGVIFQQVDMFVDFALTYALLNFIASLAASEFFERHRVIDTTPGYRYKKRKMEEKS